MPCYCYILECSDGSYYTGWTINPERRTHMHALGKGGRYTRTRLPVRLVYVEELPDQSSAMKRENKIKKMTREAKTELVKSK